MPRIDQALSPLGLGEVERAAYAYLVISGGATATELSRELNVHRNQAYRITSALMERGLTHQTVDRPMRFIPTPLDVVAAHARQQAEETIAEMEKVHDRLGERSHAAAPPRPRMQIIVGRAKAYEAMQRLAMEARSSLTLMDTHPMAGKDLMTAGLCAILAQRAEDGIDTRCILPPGACDHERPHTHLLRTPNVARWLMRDDEEAVLFMDIDDGATFRKASDRAIWSDAQALMRTLRLMFDQAWSNSPPA